MPAQDRDSMRQQPAGEQTTPEDMRLELQADEAGARLDAVLHARLNLPLRAVRRMLDDGNVRLNGRRAKKGDWTQARDVITLAASLAGPTSPAQSLVRKKETWDGQDAPCLLDPVWADPEVRAHLAFVHKPRFVHSVALAGRNSLALEHALADLLPEFPKTRLMQRLDFATSGIVTVALDDEGAELFRSLEQDGRISKHYRCLVQGHFARPETGACTVRRRLVSRGTGTRSAMQALEQEDADPARCTSFVPLSWHTLGELFPELVRDAGAASDNTAAELADLAVTLLQATIHRGARHQIRAHAASLNHPLLFDTLYGAHSFAGHSFLLHHEILEWDGVRVQDRQASALLFARDVQGAPDGAASDKSKKA